MDKSSYVLAGFCPGHALAPFVLKNSRRPKKNQIGGPKGTPNFSNQKTTKSFSDVLLAFSA